MGDAFTCKASLMKSVDPTRPDYLFLSPKHRDYRNIPCKPKGRIIAAEFDKSLWTYEERDGKLFISPSLLCCDTGFHTDYNWSVEFEICPPGTDSMTHFFQINPDREP